MISEQAKSGVDLIFTKAARLNLIIEPWDSIEIDHLPVGNDAEPSERHLFVLTIASFHFKLLTIFHIDSDPATRNYFSKPEAKLGFAEVFPELGNMCCGAMNRELGAHFAHLGMSTPYQLDRQCVPYLNVLRPTHLSRHRITIKNAVSLHATLCLNAYTPIDFRVDPIAKADETGTIELF